MAYGDSTGILPPGSTVTNTILTINGSAFDLEMKSLAQPNVLNMAYAIQDITGAVAFGILNTGQVVIPASSGVLLPVGTTLSGSNITVPGNLTLPSGNLTLTSGVMRDSEVITINSNNYLGLAFAIIDQNYNVALGVSKTGQVILYGGSSAPAASSSGTASLNQTGNPFAPNVDSISYFNALDGSSVQQVYKVAPGNSSTFATTSGQQTATVTTVDAQTQLTSGTTNHCTQPQPNQDGSSVRYVSTPVGGGAFSLLKMNRYGQHKLPMATAYTAAYALSHVSIGGQSLGIGWAGTPPTSTTQPFSNVMFNYGMVSEAANNGGGSSTFTVPTSLVPLIEQTDGSYGETIASGFVNSITKWALESGIVMPLLVTNWAIGGMGMSGLIKGTGPYANGQSQVTYGKSVGIAGGFPTVGTRGLLWVHGEADWQNASYDTQLATMQTNYETDTKTITGQATDIPMILCQCSGAGNQAGVAPGTLLSPYLQLQVSINNPGKVVLTGPSYQCLYANVHMQAAGYRKNAGYFAKAWYKTVIQNLPWRPLSPRRIVRDGSNVFVDFWVPVPPIVIDTTTITQPSFVAGSLAGFEWWDASGSPPAITAVNIIGPTSLQIVLASVPSGSNKQLRYAYSFTTGAVPGPFTGQRGNLRDSDTTTSYYGDPLPNWCVHFSQVCN